LRALQIKTFIKLFPDLFQSFQKQARQPSVFCYKAAFIDLPCQFRIFAETIAMQRARLIKAIRYFFGASRAAIKTFRPDRL
jgi:hypothetical protein